MLSFKITIWSYFSFRGIFSPNEPIFQLMLNISYSHTFVLPRLTNYGKGGIGAEL